VCPICVVLSGHSAGSRGERVESSAKPVEKVWLWPVFPGRSRSRPPNIPVDESMVRPGQEVLVPAAEGPDSPKKYVIPGFEQELGRSAELYYRPTLGELDVIQGIADGDPDDPDWGELVGLLVFNTTLSIGEARKMRSGQIVEVLARADPDRLRADIARRKDYAAAWNARFVVIGADIAERARSFWTSPCVDLDAVPLRDQTQQTGRISKPGGWSRSELIDLASEGASLSGTTFDQIRKQAGLPSGPHRKAGSRRRYSRDDLQKLINAARSGPFLNGKHIANAWQQLLEPDESSGGSL